MAAFCSCCGAELTLKAEACAACGTPRHGMLPPTPRPAAGLDPVTGTTQADVELEKKARRARL